MNAKRPRMLNLNAPLLSTRRSTTTTLESKRTNSLHVSCERVPFSWEQSPGKPKDTVRGESLRYEDLPLPKPPPIRWREETYSNGCDDINIVDNGDHGNEGEHDNEAINNNNNNCNDDAFSDGLDLFSLTSSLNPSERPDRDSARGDTDVESDIGGNNGSSSPNFMIQRFLPAATALAASSLSDLNANKHLMYPSNNDITSMEGSCVPRVAGQVFSTSKGCGFELLFPWRPKHRLSKIKSPVRRVHPSFKSQLGPRNK
ncbi:LOW QUALITY PROTEIN: hypothetical protein Cgig2_000769 [Carnegiea gigantea]|uniref:Uncharacterized protein n=1 Tax=Carnegiea gigantea TaxID=171969 RepID=A0A9Q1QL72_9CARY|nr:LOW QUALITY PROTEIN: hypothetical protein Cgig2_000769 [Carnegiea gigantea]